MPLWGQPYVQMATSLSFCCLLAIPTRLGRVQNVIVCLILAVVAGWLLWPVFVLAAFKGRLGR